MDDDSIEINFANNGRGSGRLSWKRQYKREPEPPDILTHRSDMKNEEFIKSYVTGMHKDKCLTEIPATIAIPVFNARITYYAGLRKNLPLDNVPTDMLVFVTIARHVSPSKDRIDIDYVPDELRDKVASVRSAYDAADEIDWATILEYNPEQEA